VPPHVFAVGRRELRYAGFARSARAGFASAARPAETPLQLVELQAVPLPEAAFAGGALGGPIADPAAVETALEALLARLAGPVERASLVLPDAWARATILELGDLPEAEPQRSEILRFKLKRLVPFRVEELRVAAVPLTPLPRQEEPIRVLAAFAAESLCGGLERIFAARGIGIGQIAGSTQALLAALDRRDEPGGSLPVRAVTLVQPEGFVLAFAREGEPLVWRQKSFTDGLSDADRERLLAAELRLTRTFLAERIGEEVPLGVLLAAPREVEPFWSQVIEEGFGRAPVRLSALHLPVVGDGWEGSAPDLAPMIGAACREVA
jgi:hypothetical protein